MQHNWFFVVNAVRALFDWKLNCWRNAVTETNLCWISGGQTRKQT